MPCNHLRELRRDSRLIGGRQTEALQVARQRLAVSIIASVRGASPGSPKQLNELKQGILANIEIAALQIREQAIQCAVAMRALHFRALT